MEKTTNPTEEQVNELMDTVLKGKNLALNEVQKAKFKHACIKAHIENPDANHGDLILAANVYLTYIIDFPEMTL